MFEQPVTLGPGTGTFASHTFEILLMLLGAFLLGLWLGWLLWSRYRQEAEKLRTENASLSSTVAALNSELDLMKVRVAAIDSERSDLAAQVSMLTADNRSLMERLRLAQSDLDASSTLNRQLETELALSTEEDVAETGTTPLEVVSAAAPEEQVELIIEGNNARNVDIPDHATSGTVIMEESQPAGQITIEGKEPLGTVVMEAHDDFIEHELPVADHVFESTSRSVAAPTDVDLDDHFSDAAFEDLTRSSLAPPAEVVEAAAFESTTLTPLLNQDDLKIIEGIGPKIEQLLFAAGIHTYSELAAAPVPRLKEVLAEAGPRYSMHDPGTWSAQALLAANAEWENLKAYQEFLHAGKRPEK